MVLRLSRLRGGGLCGFRRVLDGGNVRMVIKYSPDDFSTKIIAPPLLFMGLYSFAAEQLLLATAMTESNLAKIYQDGGPALGYFQMEPRTAEDVLTWTVKKRPKLIEALKAVEPDCGNFYQLARNPQYAAAMARLFYLRFPEALPDPSDPNAVWVEYKRRWNTEYGAATRSHFMQATAGIWNRTA